MMKIKKNKPLIDQHNKNGFWGSKFGGNFIPETLKKPVEDLTILFEKLRNDKNFIKERDYHFSVSGDGMSVISSFLIISICSGWVALIMGPLKDLSQTHHRRPP